MYIGVLDQEAAETFVDCVAAGLCQRSTEKRLGGGRRRGGGAERAYALLKEPTHAPIIWVLAKHKTPSVTVSQQQADWRHTSFGLAPLLAFCCSCLCQQQLCLCHSQVRHQACVTSPAIAGSSMQANSLLNNRIAQSCLALMPGCCQLQRHKL